MPKYGFEIRLKIYTVLPITFEIKPFGNKPSDILNKLNGMSVFWPPRLVPATTKENFHDFHGNAAVVFAPTNPRGQTTRQLS